MSTKSKYSHEWSLICQRSIVDQESNLLSIIDTVEQVTISLNPRSVQQDVVSGEITLPIHVVSRFRKCVESEKELQLEVLYEAHNPAGKKVGDAVPVTFVMKSGIRNFRARVTLGRVPVDTSGLYMIQVKVREAGDTSYKRVASIPIEVVVNR